jgi:uncharacterized protein
MDEKLVKKLAKIAADKIPADDPSHDANHVQAVLRNSIRIAVAMDADLDVVVPAALFHDVIHYSKNDKRYARAQADSAKIAQEVLNKILEYPKEKIPTVMSAITTCSFSQNLPVESLEAIVLQDADLLESAGAISIMRTFASSGIMNRPFYHPTDPFAQNREPDADMYGVDLFYTRLLKVEERIQTSVAKEMVKSRIEFLKIFLEQLKSELK